MNREEPAARETPSAPRLPLPAARGSMRDADLKGQRLFALFLLGCLLFNYPLFALFAGPVHLFGVPLLYVYVFTAWAILIALIALVIERRSA